MLLFKYPLQNRKMAELREQIRQETAEEDLADDEIAAIAKSRLLEEGLLSGESPSTECADYTDEEIRRDTESVDWESAFLEVEKREEEKR